MRTIILLFLFFESLTSFSQLPVLAVSKLEPIDFGENSIILDYRVIAVENNIVRSYRTKDFDSETELFKIDLLNADLLVTQSIEVNAKNRTVDLAKIEGELMLFENYTVDDKVKFKRTFLSSSNLSITKIDSAEIQVSQELEPKGLMNRLNGPIANNDFAMFSAIPNDFFTQVMPKEYNLFLVDFSSNSVSRLNSKSDLGMETNIILNDVYLDEVNEEVYFLISSTHMSGSLFEKIKYESNFKLVKISLSGSLMYTIDVLVPEVAEVFRSGSLAFSAQDEIFIIGSSDKSLLASPSGEDVVIVKCEDQKLVYSRLISHDQLGHFYPVGTIERYYDDWYKQAEKAIKKGKDFKRNNYGVQIGRSVSSEGDVLLIKAAPHGPDFHPENEKYDYSVLGSKFVYFIELDNNGNVTGTDTFLNSESGAGGFNNLSITSEEVGLYYYDSQNNYLRYCVSQLAQSWEVDEKPIETQLSQTALEVLPFNEESVIIHGPISLTNSTMHPNQFVYEDEFTIYRVGLE